MFLPLAIVETDRVGRLVTRGLSWRSTLERRMSPLCIEVELEEFQFARQVGSIPEEDPLLSPGPTSLATLTSKWTKRRIAARIVEPDCFISSCLSLFKIRNDSGTLRNSPPTGRRATRGLRG